MEPIPNYKGLIIMNKYQDEMAMVIHQGAEALHKIGAISDERMREYDSDCLAAVKFAKKQKQSSRAPSCPSPTAIMLWCRKNCAARAPIRQFWISISQKAKAAQAPDKRMGDFLE